MKNYAKILLLILIVSLIILSHTGCSYFQIGEMTEEEKQEASIAVKEYYSDLPQLMSDYLTERSQEKVKECVPGYVLITTSGFKHSNDHNYGMAEGYGLVLKNRYTLSLNYGIIKNNKIARHLGEYSSPEFQCSSLDDAIEQIKEHIPSLEAEEWIQPVFACFYPEGTDVRAEWMRVYEEMVKDIDENGLPMGEVWNKYQTDKTILTTENGEYRFVFSVYYYDNREVWDYSYHIELYPMD